MIEFTINGLKFYEQYFDIKYPFGKYDQIFVPEFAMGAMENAGAITFNEAYLFKETPTENQLTKFGITVLHEMSHMWFGDLVTMKWWNDL